MIDIEECHILMLQKCFLTAELLFRSLKSGLELAKERPEKTFLVWENEIGKLLSSDGGSMPNPRENHARMEGSRSMGFRSPRMPRFISGTTWELLKAHTQSHDQRCGGWGGGRRCSWGWAWGSNFSHPWIFCIWELFTWPSYIETWSRHTNQTFTDYES